MYFIHWWALLGFAYKSLLRDDAILQVQEVGGEQWSLIFFIGIVIHLILSQDQIKSSNTGNDTLPIDMHWYDTPINHVLQALHTSLL